MESLGIFHAVIEISILVAVVVTARKLSRLEFMVELMWEEYKFKHNHEDDN